MFGRIALAVLHAWLGLIGGAILGFVVGASLADHLPGYKDAKIRDLEAGCDFAEVVALAGAALAV